MRDEREFAFSVGQKYTPAYSTLLLFLLSLAFLSFEEKRRSIRRVKTVTETVQITESFGQDIFKTESRCCKIYFEKFF